MLKDDYLSRIKSKHYSRKTFESYWPHVEDFLRWNKRGPTWQHPKDKSATTKKTTSQAAYEIKNHPPPINCLNLACKIPLIAIISGSFPSSS